MRAYDADHGVLVLVQFQHFPEHVPVRREVRPPEEVADDRDRRRSLAFRSFGCGKEPSQERWGVEHLQSSARHIEHLHRLGDLAVGRHHALVVMKQNGFDGFGLPKLVGLRKGEGNLAAPLLCVDGDEGEPICIASRRCRAPSRRRPWVHRPDGEPVAGRRRRDPGKGARQASVHTNPT